MRTKDVLTPYESAIKAQVERGHAIRELEDLGLVEYVLESEGWSDRESTRYRARELYYYRKRLRAE